MSINRLYQLVVLSLTTLLTACGGGGGGGGPLACTTSSQFQYCTGSGSSYYCTPVGAQTTSCSSGSNGPSSTPEPQAKPFAVGISMGKIVSQSTDVSNMSPSPFVPTPDVPSYGNLNQDFGRLQVASIQITKTPSNDIFNGISVTKQTTNATWSGVLLASDYQGWYPTPYQLYFNSTNDLVGFSIGQRYGKRVGGNSMPTSANDKDMGQIGQFEVFSDSQMVSKIGSAAFSYRVNNCCDLYNKEKADLELELSGSTTSGSFSLKQSFVIYTNGNLKSFGAESFSNGSSTRIIALPFKGY
jgi:hypothetical protein